MRLLVPYPSGVRSDPRDTRSPAAIAAIGTNVLGMVVLLGINLLVARELFHVEYLRHMASIEGTHIALARNILEHWGDLVWYPLWNLGTPFANTYSPMLPAAVALLAKLTNLSVPHCYHIVVALAYCLAPAALFVMARTLSGRFGYSFAAALLFSLLSPAAFLVPAIRRDTGGFLNPRRLQDLVQYGEGPHVASLVLLPLAIMLIYISIRQRRAYAYVLASVIVSGIIATNWVATFAFLVASAAYVIASPPGQTLRSGLVVLGIDVTAYLLVAPWVPPSSVMKALGNSSYLSGLVGPSPDLFVFMAFMVGLVGVGRWAFSRVAIGMIVRFACFFALITGGLTLGAHYFRMEPIPQSQRYELELEMALCLLLPFGAQPWVDRLTSAQRRWALAALIVLAGSPFLHYRRAAQSLNQSIDIATTIEYREAGALTELCPGVRVLAPGSVGFWLNAFKDTEQLGTGSIQALDNRLVNVAYYEIFLGSDPETSLLWLMTLGVGAVGVTFPDGREIYKPYKHPEKFEGRLPVIWRERGDVVYRVIGPASSRAHVLRPGELASRRPTHALDVEPLRPYVAALRDRARQPATFVWRSFREAHIETQLEHGELLSVQVNHRPGWRATALDRSLRVRPDSLGFIVIEPDVFGRLSIRLWYDGGPETRATGVVGAGTSLMALLWIVMDLARRRSPR